RIPLVSSLAATVPNLAFDVAHHRLDCEHYSHLRHVAHTHEHRRLGIASCLGNAGGVRMRGNRRCNYLVEPHEASLSTAKVFRAETFKVRYSVRSDVAPLRFTSLRVLVTCQDPSKQPQILF